MYSNCKTRSCLFNILSLKKQPSRVAWKKILPKCPNILKGICTWIESNQPTKLLDITIPVRFFINSAYNITVYSVHYQKFNLVGCFSHKWFITSNHKCSNTLVLSISHMKFFKTKKLEVRNSRVTKSTDVILRVTNSKML